MIKTYLETQDYHDIPFLLNETAIKAAATAIRPAEQKCDLDSLPPVSCQKSNERPKVADLHVLPENGNKDVI